MRSKIITYNIKYALILLFFTSCATKKMLVMEGKHENGKVKYVIPILNKKVQDTVEVFWESGYPKYWAEYNEGKLDGESKWFHDNNILKIKTHYVNGKKHGIEENYYINGKIKSKRVYNDSVEQIDKFQSFDSLGNSTSDWKSPDGENIKLILKFNTGKPKSECTYKNNVKHGECLIWDKKTGLKFIQNFINGKLDSSKSKEYLDFEKNKKNRRSAASILNIVRKHMPPMRHIYNRHLKKGNFNSKIRLKFEIEKNGNIVYVIPIEVRPIKEPFIREILEYTWTWKFDSIHQDGNDVVIIPLTFSWN